MFSPSPFFATSSLGCLHLINPKSVLVLFGMFLCRGCDLAIKDLPLTGFPLLLVEPVTSGSFLPPSPLERSLGVIEHTFE